MIHCNPNTDKHREKLREVQDYFYSKENLRAAYGSMSVDWVHKQLSTLMLDSYHIPLSDDFVPMKNGKLDLSAYNHLKSAIDKWDKSLSKGVNSFEALVRVPSGIYKKNPVTIEFNNKISSITNAERKNKTRYLDNIKKIAEEFKQIMSAVNSPKGRYSKVSKNLDKVYDRIAEFTKKGDVARASDEVRKLNDILTSDDSKQVIDTYTYMTEKLSFDDLNKVASSGYQHPKYDVQTMKSLVNVVRETKGLLHTMGDVNIKGLKKMKDVVNKFFKRADSTRVYGLNQRIDSAIKRVEEGMKSGKYFPHYAINTMLDIESIVDNINPMRLSNDTTYMNDVIASIDATISDLPANVQESSPDKTQMFKQDPIRVLESYAENAVMFNKKQFLMDAFLDAVDNLNPHNVDFDGLNQISEYLAHKYTASMQGFNEANQSVKVLSGAISKLQTISKMGLSPTGAVRNSTQHFWYSLYTGAKNYKKGRDLLKSNATYTYSIEDGSRSEKKISDIINRVSSEEGYFFDNAAMETISMGSLIDMNGVDKKSIVYDVDEDGKPFVKYKKDGVWQKIDDSLGKLTGKSLAFHQMTENIVRKSVYQNAFAQHFDKLFTNTQYKNSLIQQNKDKGMTEGRAIAEAHRKIERDSHNMALNWVRMTQFEYSILDRPKLFGGGTTNASAIGNSVFQFFPYAAHMFELNTRAMKDGFQALYKGDFSSWKFSAAARMIGFQTFGIGLLSILFNNEFSYLIENDTYTRIKNLYNTMTAEDHNDLEFGNGLLAQLTGPVGSDTLFWMEAAGFTDFSDNEIAQLLFGYYDLESMSDNEIEASQLQRVSTTLAKVYKSRDSFINGDIMGIIRNNLLLYPSKRTREGHEKMINLLGFGDERNKKEERREALNASLTDLPEEKRQKILSVIQDLKKDSQVDRSVPPGLQNLTIR